MLCDQYNQLVQLFNQTASLCTNVQPLPILITENAEMLKFKLNVAQANQDDIDQLMQEQSDKTINNHQIKTQETQQQLPISNTTQNYEKLLQQRRTNFEEKQQRIIDNYFNTQ